jgi:hypothetical protein
VIGPNVPLEGWRLEILDERTVYHISIIRGDRSRGEHLFNASVWMPDPDDARYSVPYRGGSSELIRALGNLVGDVVASGHYACLLKPGDVPRFEVEARAQAEARRILESTLSAPRDGR